MKRCKIYKAVCFMFLLAGKVEIVTAQALNIKNDIFWNTKDGSPVRSQGGGVFRFTDSASGTEKYYWYGVYYEEADTYRDNPSVTFGKVTDGLSR